MAIDEALVQQVVEAVVAALRQGGTPPPKRTPRKGAPNAVLVVGSVGPDFEAAAPAVQELLNEVLGDAVIVPSFLCADEDSVGYMKDVFALEAVFEPGAGDSLADLVAESSVVVGVSMPLPLLAKTALLLMDDPAVQALLNGVFYERPVVCALDGCDPEAAPGQLPARMYRRLQEYLADLEGYGFSMCAAADLDSTVKALLTGAPAESGPAVPDLVTAEDVRRLASNGNSQLELPANTIITPLAKDLADELGIRLLIRD